MTSVLLGTCNFASTLRLTYSSAALESSRAYEQSLDKRHGRSCYIAFSTAMLNLEAAEDNINCIARLLVEPLPKFGHSVLARSAIESSARAWFLLEPALASSERGGRGLAELLTASHESLEMVAVTGDQTEVEAVRHHLEGVQRQCATEGFRLKPTKRGRQVIEGFARPSSTRLMAGFLGQAGELLFKDLSGVVHGVSSSLVQRYSSSVNPENPEVIHIVPRLHLAELAADLGLVVMGHLDAIGRQIDLYGWEKEQWFQWRDYALNTLWRHFKEPHSADSD